MAHHTEQKFHTGQQRLGSAGRGRWRSGQTRVLGVASVAVAALIMTAAPAFASGGSVTVTAGALGFVSPPPGATFNAVALNGQDQTTTGSLSVDVGDNRGTGAGWHIQLSTTAFTAGAVVLTGAVLSMSATPTVACDTSTTCTLATDSIPPGMTLNGTAASFYGAALTTGMSNQTVTPTFNLLVPANTLPGTYTATWTITLVTGP